MQKRRQDQDGLYRRPDSPYWWASYIDAGGRRVRRSTGTPERREAEAILAKWRVEAHRARHWNEQPSITFDELMVGFLKVSIHELRPSGYRRNIDAVRHLRGFFGGIELKALSASMIRAYIENRRSLGAASATINRELAVLSSAINYARREWDWEIPNPVSGRKLKEPEGRMRWITREEAANLIHAAESEVNAPHLARFIRLALHTGCRKRSCLGLNGPGSTSRGV